MKTPVVLLLLAAGIAAVNAGIGEPIAITPGASLQFQALNQTGGAFFTYAVSSSSIVSFKQYQFKATMVSYSTNQNFLVRAYWRNSAGSFVQITPTAWFTLSYAAVATAGYLSMTVDAKTLFDQYHAATTPPSSITIGFLVTMDTTASPNVPLIISSQLFTAALVEFSAPVANDANGEVGNNGQAGTVLTSTCPGTGSRCQCVANMRFRDHQYLEATATVTSGTFFSATLRNAAFFSVDDTKYFATANAGAVYPRTCQLTNTSCSILQDYYYVEVKTTADSNSDTNGYTVSYTTKAAAPVAATASLVTATALAVAAFFASRSH